MDEILMTVGTILEAFENLSTQEVPDRIALVNAAAELLRESTKGRRVKVKANLHTPFKSMGYVSVEGDELVFDPQVLTAIITKANNFEIYPKTNGTLQANFTFYGLVK